MKYETSQELASCQLADLFPFNALMFLSGFFCLQKGSSFPHTEQLTSYVDISNLPTRMHRRSIRKHLPERA